MPPALRSSAPNTPVSKKTTPNTTPKSSIRKVPHCTKCHRPRAGHPRQGCPYVDADSPPPATQPNEAATISDALGSLHIEQDRTPARAAPGTPTPLRRKPLGDTLDSLTTNSSAIVHKLLEPGIMNDDSGDEDIGARIAQWQQKVERPKAEIRKKEGRIMPGTLLTPRNSLLPTEPASSQEQHPAHEVTKTDVEEEELPRTRHSTPLVRTMSMEERSAFLDGLAEISKAPPAAVYIVPLADLPMMEASATKVGFPARSLTPSKKKSEADGLLIVGSDASAVQKLYERLALDIKNGKGMRTINAAAGGAVVGAVATFTGLAFA
ncbi:hypothetical protein DENSPDRAFT_831417 [Dentipellis sp. KUC8613]|nr:hypothetical protein DENSPDRAFT_831417 [Dentipellis sp. KUC8613]